MKCRCIRCMISSFTDCRAAADPSIFKVTTGYFPYGRKVNCDPVYRAWKESLTWRPPTPLMETIDILPPATAKKGRCSTIESRRVTENHSQSSSPLHPRRSRCSSRTAAARRADFEPPPLSQGCALSTCAPGPSSSSASKFRY